MSKSLQLVKTGDFEGTKFDCYQDSGKEFWGTREHLEMLPDAGTRFYSAKQVGDVAGVSNRRVMKLAREMGLIAPEGGSNEYGRWKMSKSPYSPHECAQWSFTELGRTKVLEALRDAA